jgi:hypothetical protein
MWVGGIRERTIQNSRDTEILYVGTMGSSTSPNDCVFWLHHSNIDRLWADWQLQDNHWNLEYKGYLPVNLGPTSNESGYAVTDPMKPWGIYTPASVANFYLIDAKGYKYDKYFREKTKDRKVIKDENLDIEERHFMDNNLDKFKPKLELSDPTEIKSIFGSPENLKKSVNKKIFPLDPMD